MRYYFCPHDTSKCHGSPLGIAHTPVTTGAEGMLATTINFGDGDVCPWTLVANSDFQFNKRIKITVDYVYGANVIIHEGTSYDSIDKVVQGYNNSEITINAEKNVYIVVIGAGGSGYAQIRY